MNIIKYLLAKNIQKSVKLGGQRHFYTIYYNSVENCTNGNIKLLIYVLSRFSKVYFVVNWDEQEKVYFHVNYLNK